MLKELDHAANNKVVRSDTLVCVGFGAGFFWVIILPDLSCFFGWHHGCSRGISLRVLGSPNPGQSFGRGLSSPQATEVEMTRAEVGRYESHRTFV